MDALGVRLRQEARRVHREHGRPLEVLDPFAGVGRIHDLALPGRILTTGIELEPEWAYQRSGTIAMDFLVYADQPGSHRRWDAIVSSPTYGNRLADHHNAQDGSRRHSYTHDLGRDLTPGNSGAMHWGPEYWGFHGRAAVAVAWVLRPGGLVLWNVSNFFRTERTGEEPTEVAVVEFHRGALITAGLVPDGRDVRVSTPRLRGVGTAATARRAPHEVILRFRKPAEEED
jgi:hypothetical protein